MSEWKKTLVGQVCKMNQSSYTSKDHWDYVNYLDTGSITKNFIEGYDYIDLSKTALPSRAKRKVEVGDIVYSTVRPNLCHYGMLESVPDKCLVSTGFAVIKASEDKINPRFLYYFLTLPKVVEGLHSIGEQGQATYPAINPSDILELEIAYPDRGVQDAIVSILSNYESAIANCKRQISLLEEAAMRLYNEWFKDGKGEKGPISKWFSVSIGRTPPRKVTSYFSTMADDMLWCSIADIKATNVFVFNTAEKLTKQALIDSKIHISPMGSVLLSFKLTVGRVAIAAAPLATNEAIAHFETENRALRDYTYCFLHEFPYATLGSTSAIGTAINSDIVKRIPFVMPTIRDLERFSKAVSPVFDAILAFGLQVRVLAEARDRLLPKLMKGEIAV